MMELIKSTLRKTGFDIVRHSSKFEPPTDRRIEKRGTLTISMLCDAVVSYVNSMRVYRGGNLIGYRFSACSPTATIYGTVASVLLKHLLSFGRRAVQEELSLIRSAQRENGLFYDPAMDTPLAWHEDWWGFRHLTLHCITALALYDEPCNYPVDQLPELRSEADFGRLIAGLDWGTKVAFTSNTVQNYGVFLQYARDFQNSTNATKLCSILIEDLDRRVDPITGLWGKLDLEQPALRSESIQAAYHFWLVYFYDRIAPPHMDKAVEWILATQNPCGGYGVTWNSSCCESIDSIDPLARLLETFRGHYRAQIKRSLERALADAMTTLNTDGGFTFRRGASMAYGDSASTYQAVDQSSTFFTWFRMLSIALATEALGHGIADERPAWAWKHVPGHQFWDPPTNARFGSALT
jgi:hypothetical protein